MSFESLGIVYILINESMPGYVKVGFTEGELIRRIKELDNTSTPLPFECFYAARVNDCKKVERLIHDAFLDQRVRKNREFFEVDPERVKSALKLVEVEDLTPIESELIDSNEDKEALSKKRQRRSNISFDMFNINVGEVLTFSKDHDITCKVIDNKKVEFEGEILSVSKSALKVLHSLGYEWATVNGWTQWCYKGKELTKILSDEY